MRQRSCLAVPDDAAVVHDLLELDGGLRALPSSKVDLAAYIYVIEAGSAAVLCTDNNEDVLECKKSANKILALGKW